MIPSSALLAFSSPLRVTKVRVLFMFSGQKKSLVLSTRTPFEKESRNRKTNCHVFACLFWLVVCCGRFSSNVVLSCRGPRFRVQGSRVQKTLTGVWLEKQGHNWLNLTSFCKASNSSSYLLLTLFVLTVPLSKSFNYLKPQFHHQKKKGVIIKSITNST